jgi:hypothetical protein
MSKYFADNNGPVSPIGAGLLYGLSDGVDPRGLLDYYAGKIHCTRIFCGRLTPSDTRTGQSIESVYDRLPNVLEWHMERGLRAELTCITDSLEGNYDEDAHVAEVSSIAEHYRQHVIGFECVNEWNHPSQKKFSYSDLQRFVSIAQSNYSGPIAMGAAPIDELDVNTGAYPTGWTGPNAYSTVHLNRDKKPSYREAFRIKELHDVRNRHDCGGCNNEPGRFDDESLNEPDGLGHQRFAYILGALGMSFGFMSIAHGSQMRDSDAGALVGIEHEAFQAYLRGANAVPRGQYEWQNANNTGNWPQSPIKSGAFADGPANSDSKALWRAYSYLGPVSICIAGGEGPTSEFNLEYQNDYHPIGIRDEFANTQIIELGR